MTDDRDSEGRTGRAGSPPLLRRELLVAGTVSLAGCTYFRSDSTPELPDTDQPVTDPTPDDLEPRLRFAAPGDVRAQLDDAREADLPTKIHLHPERIYQPAATWEIGPGVTLDYNGATVQVQRDVDLHEVHPGGQVLDPTADLRSLPGEYTSSVFRFDSEAHGFYGSNRTWHVRGGITRGRVGEGTLFEFAQGGENAIYFVHVDHAVHNIGTVVDMHRADTYGINGVRVQGLWYGFERGIHMHHHDDQPDEPIDNLSGNHFDVIAQPGEGAEILWDLEVGGFNILEGRFWDFAQYEDGLWRIHDGPSDKRFGNIFRWFPIEGRSNSLLQRETFADLFDDQLGDARNRVVVPWLNGQPVSEVGWHRAEG